MNDERPVGTKLSEVLPRLTWLDFKLSDKGFHVGDLVTYSVSSYGNGMTLFRIVKDCPANGDLVWTQLCASQQRWRYVKPALGWAKPGTSTRVPDIRVKGCIEIQPVIQLIPGPHVGKKTVPYRALNRLKKVDILELARTFSRIKDFIDIEVKRLSSSETTF